MKIQLYSDCDFFAGCENMMAVLMNNRDKFNGADLSFHYRRSRYYESGLRERFVDQSCAKPLHLFNFSGYCIGESSFFKCNLRRATYVVRFFILPIIFLQNIIYLYFHFRKTRPDILLLNNGGFPGALSTRLASIIAKRMGVKKVYMIVNNSAVPYESIIRRLSKWLDKLVVGHVDYFITGSELSGFALENFLGIKRCNRGVIFNCIEEKRFVSFMERMPPNKKLVFANIALLEKRKGQIILLKSIRRLIDRRSDVANEIHFYIEGVGPEKRNLEEYVLHNNLNHIVTLLGRSSSIAEVYRSCDVFILPSISNEDLPNVISEALLFSRPVIASNIAGIPSQVKDEYNGYLVAPGSIEELACSIEKCIDNRDSLARMGEKSRSLFDRFFSVDSGIEKYKELFMRGM